MTEHHETIDFPTTQQHRPTRSRKLTWLLLLGFFAALGQAMGQALDDEYIQIFYTVQEADTLTGIGQPGQALVKYTNAQTALEKFRTNHPDWHPKIVTYRLNYIAEKIASVSQKDSGSGGSGGAAGAASATAPAGSVVKLIEQGAEPRKALRLHPKEGDKQTIEITVKTATESAGSGMKMPSAKLPAMKLTMEMTVKQVATNGDISYERTMIDAGIVEEPDVVPQVAEAMQSSLASLKGVVGTGIISSRGIVKSVELKIPDSVPAQVRQEAEQSKHMIGGMMVPLPEEAVGAGAKWEFRRPFSAQGLNVEQAGTYELVSIEEERISVKATITQTAANQKMQNPAMPDAKLNLLKMKGEGTGNFTVDLAQSLPVDAATEIHSELSMEVAMGGQKQPVTTTTDVSMHLESK